MKTSTLTQKLTMLLCAIFFAMGTFMTAEAQTTLVLTTSPYTQNFNDLGTGNLPLGWGLAADATPTTLGTLQTVTGGTALPRHTAWSATFVNAPRNVASGNLSHTTDADGQTNAADRALGFIPAALADTNASLAVVLTLENTAGFQNFAATFRLQSLNITSPRTITWQVQYSVNGGTVWTNASTVGTMTSGGVTFSNNLITATFGTGMNNVGTTVHIRIIPTGLSAGSGNRPMTAIDDFILTFENYDGTVEQPQARTIIFSENMGAPTANTIIANHTFENSTTLTFSGNTDVRNSSPSTGYAGASGDGNVFFGTAGSINARYFVISEINTSNFRDFVLTFGLRQDGTQAVIDSDVFVVEVATDFNLNENTGTFTSLTFDRFVRNVAGWNLVTITGGTIPASDNLAIRFRKDNDLAWRLDDVVLAGVAIPTIIASDETMNFDVVNVNSSSDPQVLTVTGFALSNDIVSGSLQWVEGTSGFEINNSRWADYGELSITFEPTAEGSHEATITFSSTGAQSVTVTLIGEAIPESAPLLRFANHDSLSFGNIIVGNDSVRSSIAEVHANNLDNDIVITFASTGTANGTHFTATPYIGFDVRDGGSISITFAPTADGLLHDTLIITSGTETDSLALYGTGVARIAAPVALPATNVDRFSFTASWETVADVVTFSVRVYEGAEATGEPLLTRTAADSLTSFAINGLAPNTQHTFVVVARAELFGNADTSNAITFTTLPLGDNIIFTFSDSTGNAVNPVANVTVSPITGMADPVAQPIILSNSASTTPFSGGYNLALLQRTTQGTYAEFTLTPATDHTFTLQGVSFGARATGTGPTSWALRSSRDNFTADLATGTVERNSQWVLHYALALEFESSVAVTFRIYAIGGGASATATGHNFRIDDVELGVTTQIITSICPREELENSVVLFPNPVQDELNISTTETISAVKIYSLSGQLIIQQQGNRNSVDVSALPRGTYVVRIIFDNGITLSRMIVKQ